MGRYQKHSTWEKTQHPLNKLRTHTQNNSAHHKYTFEQKVTLKWLPMGGENESEVKE